MKRLTHQCILLPTSPCQMIQKQPRIKKLIRRQSGEKKSFVFFNWNREEQQVRLIQGSVSRTPIFVVLVFLWLSPVFSQPVDRTRLLQDLAFFEWKIQQNPGNPEFFFDLGTVHFQLGNLKKAQSSFVDFLHSNPEDTEALVFLGKIQRQMGNLFWARENLEKAVKLSPKNIGASCELGFVLTDLGLYNEAISIMQEALIALPLQQTRERAYLQYYLGILALAKGDQVSAQHYQDELQKIQSEFAPPLRELIELRSK